MMGSQSEESASAALDAMNKLPAPKCVLAFERVITVYVDMVSPAVTAVHSMLWQHMCCWARAQSA